MLHLITQPSHLYKMTMMALIDAMQFVILRLFRQLNIAYASRLMFIIRIAAIHLR